MEEGRKEGGERENSRGVRDNYLAHDDEASGGAPRRPLSCLCSCCAAASRSPINQSRLRGAVANRTALQRKGWGQRMRKHADRVVGEGDGCDDQMTRRGRRGD